MPDIDKRVVMCHGEGDDRFSTLAIFHFSLNKYILCEWLAMMVICGVTYDTKSMLLECGSIWAAFMFLFLSNTALVIILYFSTKIYSYTYVGYILNMLARTWIFIVGVVKVFPDLSENDPHCTNFSSYHVVRGTTFWQNILYVIILISAIIMGIYRGTKKCNESELVKLRKENSHLRSEVNGLKSKVEKQDRTIGKLRGDV